jgi:hypothetical protein
VVRFYDNDDETTISIRAEKFFNSLLLSSYYAFGIVIVLNTEYSAYGCRMLSLTLRKRHTIASYLKANCSVKYL